MSMRRVAALTIRDTTGYCVYDTLLQAPLAALGITLVEVPWDEPDHDWSQYAAVVVRSTWDYTERLDAFLIALEEIARQTRLHNPLEVIRWNAHKRYLDELAAHGVRTIPTLTGCGIDTSGIHALFEALNADEIIVKPAVSANARDTFRLRRDDDMRAAAAALHATDYLAQPFIESVLTQGEVSLVFFDGELSHALRKTPKHNDFRVQEEHGGHLAPITASPEHMALAQHIFKSIPWELLYARVDLLKLPSGWALIELELIEPSLYFPLDARSPKRFAQAIAGRLGIAPG